MRLLIVGDDFLSREMMHQLFVRNGDFPVCVESGEEALAMMPDNRFDVVLTDINLPDMSGFELYETLHHSVKPGQLAPPVIGLSTEPDSQLIEAAKQKGMLSVLKRPALPAEIARLLESGAGEGQNPGGEDTTAFDPTALSQLVEVVGKEKVWKLIEMFFIDLEKGLQELLQLIREKDSKAASDLAHKLAGSCANYGLLASRTKLKETQRLCEQGNFADCIGPVESVIHQITPDREQVNRLLA
ncbi:MAG: response regulator [Gammaproteobacteria bacterium]|jgi:two-component system, OmpR family, sensor histidine kinase TorS